LDDIVTSVTFIAMDDLERVAAMPWFAALEAEARMDLIRRGRLRRRAAGEWLFGEGDEDTGVVALLEGALGLHAQAPGGGEVLIGVLQPGGMIGQSIVFGGGPRLLTVICVEASLLFTLSDQALRRAIERHPSLWRGLLALAYGQQRASVEALAIRVGLRPRQRLVAQLLTLSRRQRRAPVSQSALAEMIGVSRKAVNGWLGELEAAGLVTRGYGALTIDDRAGLARRLRD
jgi:CRP-like cAMP-binding protein